MNEVKKAAHFQLFLICIFLFPFSDLPFLRSRWDGWKVSIDQPSPCDDDLQVEALGDNFATQDC
jgi:hypothetical protein